MIHLGLTFLIGAVMAVAVSVVAWRARALSPSGAVAAAGVGTVAVAAGADFALLLIFYFVSSTLLSRFGKRRKAERTAGMIEKQGARDARQVLANGLVFGVICWMNVFSAPPELFLVVGTGALAASAADTWATEIGTLFGGTPRSILTWRPLPVGVSGGVSGAGTLASIAGSAVVSGFAVSILWLSPRYFPWLVAGGFAGSLVDSIAGALIQERRWCDACGSPTEMRIHVCGARTRRVGGLPFVENDAVNLLATAAGAVTTVLLLRAFA
jgi:uncharacterized protein (TIGR00297 family)